MHDLISNLDKLHTTEMGRERVRRNLDLPAASDIIALCREMILSPDAQIERRGKNYYITVRNCIITINAGAFTVITAHREK